MEQATNQFTKGLQMDTNPMVQGNDTMTDCLNGTLITMNGNEVILQNDMGNRRVDKAFLPIGYEPVGMKEYGGVIYVAAYNPITKLCQIGSFPSPKRTHSNKQYSSSISNFNCLDTDNEYYINENTITQLFPLTNENAIHVGDKFVVVDSNVWSALDENDERKISNLDNINNSKIKSPKNKLYTLAIGILNDGQFYDITNNLVRYDSNGNIISFDENTSDIIKFNTGYFIAPSASGDIISDTIKDSDVIGIRLAIPANTYSEKFIGPLYLKKTYNCIQKFNYDFQAVRRSEINNNDESVDKIIITITGVCTYNCPDGLGDSGNITDGVYERDGCGQITTNSHFKFFDVEFDENSEEIETSGNITYDRINNLYTAIVTRKYKLDYFVGDLNYNIKVIANSKCNGYIKSLSSLDNVFNTSLLDTTQLVIDGWRFRRTQDSDGNYLNQTELVYNLQKYQTRDIEFRNLTLYLKDIEKNNNNDVITLSGFPIKPGTNSIILDWDDLGLEERKLYEVSISYNILDIETGQYLNQLYTPSGYTIVSNNGAVNVAHDVSEVFTPLSPRQNGYHSTDEQIDPNDQGTPITPINGNRVLLTENNSQSEPSVVFDAIGENNFEIKNLWILTTELFNDCFDSVRNYCITEDETENGTTIKVLSNEKIKEKLNNLISIEFDASNTTVSNLKNEVFGSPVIFGDDQSTDINYGRRYESSYNVTGKYEFKLGKYSHHLYPDFLRLGLSLNQNSILLSNVPVELDESVGNSQEFDEHFDNRNLDGTINSNMYLYNDNSFRITGKLNYFSKLWGTANASRTVEVQKSVVPIQDVLTNKIFPGNGTFNDFISPAICYVSGGFDASRSGDKYHYIIGTEYNYSIEGISNHTVNDNGSGITNFSRPVGSGVIYDAFYDDLMFDSRIKKELIQDNKKLFTYLFLGDRIGQGDITDIKFFKDNESISLSSSDQGRRPIRVFIKCKLNDGSYRWRLCCLDDEHHYFTVDPHNNSNNDNDKKIPLNIKDMLTKYNDNNGNSYNIYAYVKNRSDINIKYPSNYERTEDLDNEVFNMNTKNISMPNTLLIQVPQLNHPFINTLNIGQNVSINNVKFKINVSTNIEDLNEKASEFYTDRTSYDGIIVTGSIGNEIPKGTSTTADGTTLNKNYNFYYCKEGKLYPLKSNIDLDDDNDNNCYNYNEETVFEGKIFDRYEIDNLTDAPFEINYYNNTDNETRVVYLNNLFSTP